MSVDAIEDVPLGYSTSVLPQLRQQLATLKRRLRADCARASNADLYAVAFFQAQRFYERGGQKHGQVASPSENT